MFSVHPQQHFPLQQEFVQLLCCDAVMAAAQHLGQRSHKLPINDAKLHAFQQNCISLRKVLAETTPAVLQSPLNASVVCMLLMGYQLQMRDEPLEMTFS